MQDALVAKMQERLAELPRGDGPEALMKHWLPGGMQGLAEIQERFWSQLMSGMAGAARRRPARGKRAEGP